jgi:hypothetical protein
MSSILLPPSEPQPPSEPPASEQQTSALSTALVVAPERPQYVPEPPPQPSRFWRMVKWPLRKLFLALYVIGSAIKRHRRAALVVLALLVLVGGGTYGLYRATHPQPASTARQTGGASGSTQPQTPFTITSAPTPPLPNAVIAALHAHKTYNAKEFWDGLSPDFQAYLQANQLGESAYQQIYDQEKAAGVVYDQFIYVGGYLAIDGVGNYTVEAVAHVGQQEGIDIWYFTVDPNGQISYFSRLPRGTPSLTSGTTGP